MKTNYKDMAKRYAAADEYVLSQLPHWKKITVIECRKLNETSRILDEFAASVAKLAESEDEIPEKSKPQKKKVDKKKKPVKV